MKFRFEQHELCSTNPKKSRAIIVVSLFFSSLVSIHHAALINDSYLDHVSGKAYTNIQDTHLFSNSSSDALAVERTRLPATFSTANRTSGQQSLTLARTGNERASLAKTCHNTPLREPIWEWHHFGENTTSTGRRLLIAQYSGFGKYARLLELTSPANKEYAKQWRHDFVVLQGTSMLIPEDKNCNPPEERSRFNKLTLLHMALERADEYDQLLILDADALIYNFTYDLTTMLSDNNMLVAQRVHKDDPSDTWNINNGVVLWNLHHPLTATVSRAWDKISRLGLPGNRPFRGDQFYLHKVLKHLHKILPVEDLQSLVSSVWDEFYYRDGTVVKHFQRSNLYSWADTGLYSRQERIKAAVDEIYERFHLSSADTQDERTNYTADGAPPFVAPIQTPAELSLIESDITLNSTSADITAMKSVNTTGSSPLQFCKHGLRRQPVWEWRFNSNETIASSNTTPHKRLLIAQYSGFGGYARLLELTSPLNKAYARKWRQDFLTVQGAALTLPTDGQCEPPRERARYDKLELLRVAYSHRHTYDQLLLLDADAMISDFQRDITDLLDGDDLLAAHRVDRNDGLRTWNVNNGVTLWNLHHSLFQNVTAEWHERTRRGLSGPKAHGDQFYLQILLKHSHAQEFVKAIRPEFYYENGTVVKHFLRQNFSIWNATSIADREALIQSVVDDICNRRPEDCEELENKAYTTV